jgi:hypothetical protein
MIVHQPNRLAAFSALMAAFNAIVAAALGLFALATVFVGVLIGSIFVYRGATARPLARLAGGVLHLRSRSLSVSVDVDTIEGWRREGRFLSIRVAGREEVVVGPYWSETPARELEEALSTALPAKR